MINSGKLSSMISEGISGITSNPAIFQKALSSENTYDKDIKSLTNLDGNAKNIFQKEYGRLPEMLPFSPFTKKLYSLFL